MTNIHALKIPFEVFCPGCPKSISAGNVGYHIPGKGIFHRACAEREVGRKFKGEALDGIVTFEEEFRIEVEPAPNGTFNWWIFDSQNVRAAGPAMGFKTEALAQVEAEKVVLRLQGGE